MKESVWSTKSCVILDSLLIVSLHLNIQEAKIIHTTINIAQLKSLKLKLCTKSS